MCFVKIKRKDKLYVNTIKTIFIRYSSQTESYKYYDFINKYIYISRYIIFIENEPYFKQNKISN
jgi:hypothetical protein